MTRTGNPAGDRRGALRDGALSSLPACRRQESPFPGGR